MYIGREFAQLFCRDVSRLGSFASSLDYSRFGIRTCLVWFYDDDIEITADTESVRSMQPRQCLQAVVRYRYSKQGGFTNPTFSIVRESLIPLQLEDCSGGVWSFVNYVSFEN